MSLASLLSIARSALLAHQRAMAVTAHNVANAQTPGYSRQRLELLPATPLIDSFGAMGRGVSDAGVRRARDLFFDASYRRDSGLLGGSSTLTNFLGQIESVMNEPSDLGIAAALDRMFQAFGDLANDPSAGPNRELTRQAAIRLVQQLHQLDSQIGAVSLDAGAQMRDEVSQVNSLADKIAALNTQILSAGGAAHSAPDLEDQRDLLIDQLSERMSVRALVREDGTVSVLAGDTMLVDGGHARQLEVRVAAGGGFNVASVGGSVIDPGSGSLAALVDLTTTRLPSIEARLDLFAKSLVTEVNAIHRAGYTPGGLTNTDFFDPAAMTAGTITLAAPIATSADAIAAGATPAPGDGSIALQLAGLAGAGVASLSGKSLREYYVEIAAAVGLDVQHAAQDSEIQLTLVDHADGLRQSVSGVSVEEEMVALIAQQQAYSAAARLIKVADEMVQDMLTMLR